MALTLKSLMTFFSAQREEDLYFSKLSKSNEIKIFAENCENFFKIEKPLLIEASPGDNVIKLFFSSSLVMRPNRPFI
jgi:hypothetical protein